MTTKADGRPTVRSLVIEFFESRPNEDVQHGLVCEYVYKKYQELYGRWPQSTWKETGTLWRQGFLTKVRWGVYRYAPRAASQAQVAPHQRPIRVGFTRSQRKSILERDEHRCVVCGYGEREGYHLMVVPMRAHTPNEKPSIVNGVTLCAMHYYARRKLLNAGQGTFASFFGLVVNGLGDFTPDFRESILALLEERDIQEHVDKMDRPQ